MKLFAGSVRLPDWAESYSMIFVESCPLSRSDIVTFSTPVITSYVADDRPGKVVSCGYDTDADRPAAFALPQTSAMPPGSMATLRGWFRATNAALCVLFSTASKWPSLDCLKWFAGNVTLPDKVESYSIIFVEL